MSLHKEIQSMKKLLAVFVSAMGLSSVMASEPIQLSLTPDIALFERSERIEGLALSIWGENPQSALALGFVNGSTGQSAGLSWSFILNYAEDYKGVQWAAVNYTEGDFFGWQAGFVNYAGKLTGLQLGFVNLADSAETGVQIGLVNLMPHNAWFNKLPDELAPGMIFVNWCF